MKKIGMFFWAFGFALLLGFPNGNTAEVSEGMKLYTRTNLTTKGKKIYYHNLRSSKGFILVGTAVEVKKVGEEKIKFMVLNNGMEYSLEAPSADFEKYFVKTKDELRLNDMSQETLREIENMNVKVGMTKAEVYISRGCPSYIGFGKKSWFHTFDQVMNSNTWYYNLSRRGIENIVRFKDGVVAAIQEPDARIYRERTELYEEKVEVAVTTPQPKEPGKVRIGVLTDLTARFDRKYFAHLKEVLGKREDCQLLKLSDPIRYDMLDVNEIRNLGRKYQIDMIISLRSTAWSTGDRFYTKLIDVSDQKVVKLDRMFLRSEHERRWEKMLVRKQIGPIEKMIDQISREKMKSK